MQYAAGKNEIYIKNKDGIWEDKTREIDYCDKLDSLYQIRFLNSPKIYNFGTDRVNVRHIDTIDDLPNDKISNLSEQIFNYFKQAVNLNPDDGDPLKKAYKKFDKIDPESVLSLYLEGSATDRISVNKPQISHPIILPFQSNHDQRVAVENVLSNRISIIQGPPGTGKTETILNIISNILLDSSKTVGVVSFGNAAVDNVREKLDETGFSFVAARLGNSNSINEFIEGQAERNRYLSDWLKENTFNSGEEENLQNESKVFQDIAASENELMKVWSASRELSQIKQKIASLSLEHKHFLSAVGEEAKDDIDIKLLRKPPTVLLDYLTEQAEDRLADRKPGLLKRIQRYFKYGSLRVSPSGSAFLEAAVKKVYYEKELDRLDSEKDKLENALAGLDVEQIRKKHQEISTEVFTRAVYNKYNKKKGLVTFSKSRFRGKTKEFLSEYPVVLTTCHSIRSNLKEGNLLDWLIIDEASQVDISVAVLAMSCARNVVIVGDLKQLGHIPSRFLQKRPLIAPSEPYDLLTHNILSSVQAIYSEEVAPRTLLSEHFRCPPEIIEFCNRMFYDGKLVPMTSYSEGKKIPLSVLQLVKGNHMRTLYGSPMNQREADAIIHEVLKPAYARKAKTSGDLKIGVATPFRQQKRVLQDSLTSYSMDQEIADTVHRFQGRSVETMIFSTVLDSSDSAKGKIEFVDDPRLVNVAVSRAKKHFVLVVNNEKLKSSTYISELVEYISSLDPEQIRRSRIVSVFDLLYKDYSNRLVNFARKIPNDKSEYASENIIWAVLEEILSEERYRNLDFIFQYSLRDLLPDTLRLDENEKRFVANGSSVDFVVTHKVSKRRLLVIEVDGFRWHAANPNQLENDRKKDAILQKYNIPLLRLPTNGSGEYQKIREALNKSLGYD